MCCCYIDKYLLIFLMYILLNSLYCKFIIVFLFNKEVWLRNILF